MLIINEKKFHERNTHGPSIQKYIVTPNVIYFWKKRPCILLSWNHTFSKIGMSIAQDSHSQNQNWSCNYSSGWGGRLWIQGNHFCVLWVQEYQMDKERNENWQVPRNICVLLMFGRPILIIILIIWISKFLHCKVRSPEFFLTQHIWDTLFLNYFNKISNYQ